MVEKNLLYLKENEIIGCIKLQDHGRRKTRANIQIEKGIVNRQIRSIQTEGHFGDIKENEKFRRFLHGMFRKFEGKPVGETA